MYWNTLLKTIHPLSVIIDLYEYKTRVEDLFETSLLIVEL